MLGPFDTAGICISALIATTTAPQHCYRPSNPLPTSCYGLLRSMGAVQCFSPILILPTHLQSFRSPSPIRPVRAAIESMAPITVCSSQWRYTSRLHGRSCLLQLGFNPLRPNNSFGLIFSFNPRLLRPTFLKFSLAPCPVSL